VIEINYYYGHFKDILNHMGTPWGVKSHLYLIEYTFMGGRIFSANPIYKLLIILKYVNSI
jgi:hypothetical protein